MKIDSFSVALYAISMVITGFAFMLLRLAIGWRLRHGGALNRQDKSDEAKHWISLALYLIAIPLAFYHSYPRRSASSRWSPSSGSIPPPTSFPATTTRTPPS